MATLDFGEPVEVDITARKRVLITGAGSYIGESFCEYASEFYKDNFQIETLDMLNPIWREHDFHHMISFIM